MGDRISIQFQNGEDKSVVLFSHWGGQEFLARAKKYVADLQTWEKNRKDRISVPLSRFEPRVVMVDFVRELTAPGPNRWNDEERVTSDLYFGLDENDGDNSDNGHHIITLPKNKD